MELNNFNTDEPLESYDRIYVDNPFGNRIELMVDSTASTDLA